MKKLLSTICVIFLLAVVGCEAVRDDESGDTISQISETESSYNESEGSSDNNSTSESSLPDKSESEVSQEVSQEESSKPDESDEPIVDKPINHSELYISGIGVEEVILWFNEVVLDAEFVTGGNATVVQKWNEPLKYYIEGETTEKDIEVFEDFVAKLNEMKGFPGISKAENPIFANFNVYFCPLSEFEAHLNIDLGCVDGGVTFWYIDNAIYNATVCYRNDIDQITRNSVILEEIYNGLGPAQDTNLRTDSIIYSGFSEPQELTDVDWLILKLLYHPDIKSGMTASQCEQVIRKLYY